MTAEQTKNARQAVRELPELPHVTGLPRTAVDRLNAKVLARMRQQETPSEIDGPDRQAALVEP